MVEANGAHLEIGKCDLEETARPATTSQKGIHLDATIDDVWVHRWEGAPSRSGNFRIGLNDPNYIDYWNCDALIAESGVTNLRVDNVEAYGCTDGGF